MESLKILEVPDQNSTVFPRHDDEFVAQGDGNIHDEVSHSVEHSLQASVGDAPYFHKPNRQIGEITYRQILLRRI
jgi:hypothetical protein